MTEQQQREAIRAEVARRMTGPDALDRLSDLVWEWRSVALRQFAHKVEEMHQLATEVIP